MLKKAGIAFLSFLLFVSLSGFGVGFVMNRTLLSPDFAIAQVDRLDVPALAGEALRDQIPLEEILGEMEFIVEAVDDTIADLEPWIKQQADTAIYAGYDYLLGKTESLSIVIDLAPAKESMRENVWQALIVSLPPEIAELPQAELEQLFDEFYGELAEQIPATFEINESMLNTISPDIMDILEQARLYVGYLLLAYRISIGVMIGSIVGLVFLHRRVKSAARSIGIPFLISGISAFVGAIVAGRFVAAMIAGVELPAQLQNWVPQFMSDVLAPMRMLGIGFMAVGIALLIISVVYKRREPSG
jgi:hypothetical protein